MSFHLVMRGKKPDLLQNIQGAHAPGAIKAFLEQALSPHANDVEIAVDAYGHLWDGHSYDVTEAKVRVARHQETASG